MPTQPSDYIQHGKVITIGADGQVADIQDLNPQQLATTATADKLLEWLDANIPEGQKWTKINLYADEGADPHHAYNCPCWQAKANNGKFVSAGLTWYNLFEYPAPTQATLDELHTLAAS